MVNSAELKHGSVSNAAAQAFSSGPVYVERACVEPLRAKQVSAKQVSAKQVSAKQVSAKQVCEEPTCTETGPGTPGKP